MRETAVIRRTNETAIEIELNLDGSGESSIETGIGFFDHMLAGIRRYGSALIPMDETLAECALDLSGRRYLVFNAEFTAELAGDFPLEMVEEFFRAVAFNGEFNLHLNLRYGKTNHHMAEGLFKAFAHALKEAVVVDGFDVLSTKGVLA